MNKLIDYYETLFVKYLWKKSYICLICYYNNDIKSVFFVSTRSKNTSLFAYV